MNVVRAAVTTLVYLQILLGATMRHTGAGLAIPDFPLMFGGLVPDHWDSKIGIHFSHRVGALMVTLSVLALVARIRSHHRSNPALTAPATGLMLLVAVQIALGAVTVLSERAVSGRACRHELD